MGDAAQVVWRWSRFRFLLRFRDEAILPPYNGAIFRGVFGKGLRRLVCLAPEAGCGECAFAATCLYTALFESPAPGAEDARKYQQLPWPMVLNPPLSSRQGFHDWDGLDFELGRLCG